MTPESGIRNGKNRTLDPGSAINIPHHISKSLVVIICVKMLKFFVENPDPGSGDFF
jgi:hypothetical protein